MSFEIVDTRSGELSRAFHFSRTGLSVKGKPTFEAWQSYGYVLAAIQEGVLWALGDWWLYGERAYGEAASQAAPTGYALETCRGAAWVAERFESVRRRTDLPWMYHKEVAALPPDEADVLLDWVEAERRLGRPCGRADLRAKVRERRVLPVPIFPSGRFAVLYADPPWSYDNSGFVQSAASQYPTLNEEQLCTFTDANGRSIIDISAEGSVLFLWATSPLLDQAFRVMAAWEFSHKASMVWKKDRAPGLGWWVQTYHELLLIGTRGDTPQPKLKPKSVIEAPVQAHSAKPAKFAETIEAMFPGPKDGTHYVELFCRSPRAGWAVFGNQVKGDEA